MKGENNMKCRCGYEIKAYKSAAGWYLGTHDNEGFPQCRISGYADTEEDAYNLPLIREFADENAFCNRGRGCINQDAVILTKLREDYFKLLREFYAHRSRIDEDIATCKKQIDSIESELRRLGL